MSDLNSISTLDTFYLLSKSESVHYSLKNSKHTANPSV